MIAVIDASAVLALLLDEPGADVVAAHLDEAIICAVNVSEVAHGLVRHANAEVQARALIAALDLRVIDADLELALDCAFLRKVTDREGLSPGDRFCIALGRRHAAPILTADRAWENVAETCGVEVRLIR